MYENTWKCGELEPYFFPTRRRITKRKEGRKERIQERVNDTSTAQTTRRVLTIWGTLHILVKAFATDGTP